jgi:hypothetical protein
MIVILKLFSIVNEDDFVPLVLCFVLAVLTYYKMKTFNYFSYIQEKVARYNYPIESKNNPKVRLPLDYNCVNSL